MSPDRLFELFSSFVLLGWLALVAAPLRRGLAVGIARWVVAILCGAYLALLVAGLAGPGLPAGAGFDTLAGVRLLLSTPEALLAGWVHYLAFDLFVGSWQVADAPTARVPHWLLIPCLALTFLAGPVGLLLYLVIKAARR
ncbi:ABA4-like family protein [Polymorphobacter fuscus]|uniref:DUF4281 domain-containing protein n=1 Tax=Sandarakinorhabdus fusca TaxID=1439888 RepID=A0A7C9GPL6_9SPHN|nr:ABA4-like family protein [Polymorphobacter fuscus]KAB7647529.1 DUF4281 domain-containing protein [Polymorphobacter fuscus]MQT16790.1 DUF4281 domain-containing protein [Polymorphobacter fuscus]NJC09222.1 hypothetical protein [Polymorphobacter fuscus]